MTEEKVREIAFEQIADFRFAIEFSPGEDRIVTDEPAPLGQGEGPTPTQLLAAAVASCMASSLQFALKKFKNQQCNIHGKASLKLVKNERGRLRVKEIEILLHLSVSTHSLQHLEKILEQFDEFCVVGRSVGQGISIRHKVFDKDGVLLCDKTN